MLSSKKEILQKVYPWVILCLCFLMVMIALGFGSWSRSTFLKVVTVQLNMDRGAFSLSDSIRNILTSVLSLFFGRILLRLNIRKMTFFGFLFLTASFVANTVATQYWHFYVGGVFLGIGVAWTTTSVVGIVIDRWFTGKTGTLMGIVLAANGLGGFLAENVINRIIFGADFSVPIEEGNFRLAYGVIAIIFAVTGVVVALIMRNSPEEMGIQKLELRGNNKKKRKVTVTWEGHTVKENLRKPYFYLAVIATLLGGFILQSLVGLAKPHMQDVGIPMDVINSAFSVYAFLLLGSKILIGILFDRFGLKISYLICGLGAIGALICMYLQSPDRLIFTYLYIVLAPIGLPLETVMVPLFSKGMFGTRSFAEILGYFLAINTVGMAVGTTAINWVYDYTGTYLNSLLVLCGCGVLMILFAMIAMNMAKKEQNANLPQEQSPEFH